MKKKSVSSIKDILEKIIKNNKFEEKLNGVEILKQLDVILGDSLNKYITKRYFLDGIIYLHLSSSVLRSEISYQKKMANCSPPSPLGFKGLYTKLSFVSIEDVFSWFCSSLAFLWLVQTDSMPLITWLNISTVILYFTADSICFDSYL